MNWANKITILRLILLPIVIILLLISGYGALDGWNVWTDEVAIGAYHLKIAWIIAAIIFGIAAFTDFLDGWVARKYNQTTTFGKFADAVADKILNNSVIIIFAVMQILPIWMVLIGFIRDFTIDALRQILSSKNILMGAGPLGKWRTAIQMIGLFILFFINFHAFNGSWNQTGMYDEYGWINQLALIPMYLATLFAIISMCDYINKNKKVILGSLKSDENIIISKKDEKDNV